LIPLPPEEKGGPTNPFFFFLTLSSAPVFFFVVLDDDDDGSFTLFFLDLREITSKMDSFGGQGNDARLGLLDRLLDRCRRRGEQLRLKLLLACLVRAFAFVLWLGPHGDRLFRLRRSFLLLLRSLRREETLGDRLGECAKGVKGSSGMYPLEAVPVRVLVRPRRLLHPTVAGASGMLILFILLCGFMPPMGVVGSEVDPFQPFILDNFDRTFRRGDLDAWVSSSLLPRPYLLSGVRDRRRGDAEIRLLGLFPSFPIDLRRTNGDHRVVP